MPPKMLELALAGLAWTALHFVVAGALRPALAARIGEHGFRLLFSLLSFASLGWLVSAWRTAPVVPLYPGNPWLPLVLMPPACVLLTAAARPSNPTSVMGELTLGQRLPVHGITRVTRHPMLWAFALWGAAHVFASGTLGGLLLSLPILATAVRGMFHIDAKRRRVLGSAWDAFASVTSRFPFAAIAARRQRFVGSEIGWAPVVGGLALFVALVLLHERLTGVPLPW